MKEKSSYSHKRGVTLVELLTVIAIMGVLAGLGYPSLRQAVMNNRTKDAALNTVAFLERVASEAERISGPICLKMNSQQKITAYKGTDITKVGDGDFVAELSLDAPMQFVTGNCGGQQQSGNWIDASNASTGKSVFWPKLGLSAAPLSGFVCVRYGNSNMYGAAIKEAGVNTIRPKINFDIVNGTWVDP
jgi:prepilin-type N-terminal cleavage/methylation domain-containing protein